MIGLPLKAVTFGWCCIFPPPCTGNTFSEHLLILSSHPFLFLSPISLSCLLSLSPLSLKGFSLKLRSPCLILFLKNYLKKKTRLALSLWVSSVALRGCGSPGVPPHAAFLFASRCQEWLPVGRFVGGKRCFRGERNQLNVSLYCSSQQVQAHKPLSNLSLNQLDSDICLLFNYLLTEEMEKLTKSWTQQESGSSAPSLWSVYRTPVCQHLLVSLGHWQKKHRQIFILHWLKMVFIFFSCLTDFKWMTMVLNVVTRICH